MAPTNVTLTIPEAEVLEAKEMAESFTGTGEQGLTPKQLLAALFNENMRKWRNSVKSQAAGKVS